MKFPVPAAAADGSSPALTAVAMAAVLCVFSSASYAASPREREAAQVAINISLSDIAAGKGGFVVNGAGAYQQAGFSIAGVGDVNGDGLDDLLIGAPYADANGDWAGISYVVFGRRGTQAVDLAAVDAGAGGGFSIRGEGLNLGSGARVAAAGDVNGDGLADLVVGVLTFPYSGGQADRSYVVFGKADSAPVELAAIAAGGANSRGFAIHADNTRATATGFNVSAAGDFDGDGLGDVVVGVMYEGREYNAGLSYVVFGKRDSEAVELSALAQGQGGVVINGEMPNTSGSAAAGVGDVNGDGMADLLIGAISSSPGLIYVVFGRPGTAPIELSDITAGDGGFLIFERAYNAFGIRVAAAGDVNGDGLADVLIGEPFNNHVQYLPSGLSYVVFGRRSPGHVDLEAVAAGRGGGFVIRGEANDAAYSGSSVAGVGDINGDGLADILVGARGGEGRAYLVLGKADTEPIELAAVTNGSRPGLTIFGESGFGQMGSSVSGAGDVNGDGLMDFVVAAPRLYVNGEYFVGRSYVVFGSTRGAFAPSEFEQLGGRGDDTLIGTADGEGLAGGAGSDTLLGNGGADVLAGGPGDDTLVVDASLAKALRGTLGEHRNTGRLARLEGGAGFDTLKLSGANITLDLRGIANQGASLPGSRSRVSSIERIDLTGSGDNTLTISVADVQDMAGMNRINAGNRAAHGWLDGSYRFPATVRRHQLVVDGNAGDRIAGLPGAWRNVGTVLRGGKRYDVWNSRRGRAQLLLNQEVEIAGELVRPWHPRIQADQDL